MLETTPEIARVLRRYSQRFARTGIALTAGSAGFSGARVWRLEAANSVWALRRWPAHAFPAVRLRGLHRLLAHIEQSGLSCIAVPVPDDAGETLCFDGGHEWQVEPWLPGVADFHRVPNAARLAAAMKVLAAWHRAAATFVPQDDCRRWFASHPAAPSPAVGERLQLWRHNEAVLLQARHSINMFQPEKWHDLCRDLADRIESLGPKIASELQQFQDQAFPLQPCLRDVWHDHVLFTGDSVTGLIDPSACRTENVATDLARLLGSLIEDDAAAWNVALEAYRQIRPLNLAEERLIGVLDRSGIVLSALTWLKWLFVERRSFPDLAAVEARLQALHRRLTRLAQRT